jgi:general secretion pathway protein L
MQLRAIHACELGLRFVRWWGNELALSFPSDIRRRFFRQRDPLLVRLHDNEVEVNRPEDSDGGWRSLTQQDAVLETTGNFATLLLSQQAVLRRAIELPYAAAETLQETTGFQIPRVTPFALEDIYHVARVLSRDRKKKIIKVEIAVIPRLALQRELAFIEGKGIQPSAILVEGDVSGFPFDFLPRMGRRSKQHGIKRWWPIITVAAVLMVASPFLAAYRIHVAAQASMAEAAESAKIARKASTTQSQLDAAIVSRSFLPDRLRGPHAIEVLDALSRLVPDSAWLFHIEVRPQEATISGFSSDLPALLQKLAADPFNEPELTSPVVQGRTDGQTRFDIRLRYRGGS